MFVDVRTKGIKMFLCCHGNRYIYSPFLPLTDTGWTSVVKDEVLDTGGGFSVGEVGFTVVEPAEGVAIHVDVDAHAGRGRHACVQASLPRGESILLGGTDGARVLIAREECGKAG